MLTKHHTRIHANQLELFVIYGGITVYALIKESIARAALPIGVFPRARESRIRLALETVHYLQHCRR